jgi:hypothetical protein
VRCSTRYSTSVDRVIAAPPAAQALRPDDGLGYRAGRHAGSVPSSPRHRARSISAHSTPLAPGDSRPVDPAGAQTIAGYARLMKQTASDESPCGPPTTGRSVRPHLAWAAQLPPPEDCGRGRVIRQFGEGLRLGRRPHRSRALRGVLSSCT